MVFMRLAEIPNFWEQFFNAKWLRKHATQWFFRVGLYFEKKNLYSLLHAVCFNNTTIPYINAMWCSNSGNNVSMQEVMKICKSKLKGEVCQPKDISHITFWACCLFPSHNDGLHRGWQRSSTLGNNFSLLNDYENMQLNGWDLLA